MIDTSKWHKCSDKLPPEGIEVQVIIDDANGQRNESCLVRQGTLWFSGDTYMYWRPTHWRELTDHEKAVRLRDKRRKIEDMAEKLGEHDQLGESGMNATVYEIMLNCCIDSAEPKTRIAAPFRVLATSADSAIRVAKKHADGLPSTELNSNSADDWKVSDPQLIHCIVLCENVSLVAIGSGGD